MGIRKRGKSDRHRRAVEQDVSLNPIDVALFGAKLSIERFSAIESFYWIGTLGIHIQAQRKQNSLFDLFHNLIWQVT